jgi:hypothetical protein
MDKGEAVVIRVAEDGRVWANIERHYLPAESCQPVPLNHFTAVGCDEILSALITAKAALIERKVQCNMVGDVIERSEKVTTA